MVVITVAIASQVRLEPQRWRHWLFFWCIWMLLIIVLARTIARLFHLV
jgi:hypothetical protein